MNRKNDNSPLPENQEAVSEEIVSEETVTAEADAVEETENKTEETATVSQVPAPKPKKFSALLKSRKLRFGAVSTAITVVVIAMIVLLNVIVGIVADKFPLATDLTSKQTYSLGETSLKIANEVKKSVEITVFASESNFTSPNSSTEELNTVMRQFHQMVKEYGTRTSGLVTVKYIDLDSNPNAVTTYADYNVKSGSILFKSGSNYKVSSIDSLYTATSNYSTGAYDITTEVENTLAVNINAVCNGNNIVITFAGGHTDEYTASAQSALEKLYTNNGYTIEEVDLSTSTKINPKSMMLVAVGPKTDFSATEIQRIRDYLENDGAHGRNLQVFCNYAGSCPNLYEFLKTEYGIEVTPEYIEETDSNNIPTDSSYGSLPYIPITTVADNTMTPSYVGSKITFGLCMRLKTNGKTDTENYTLTNVPLVTFPETAQLVPITSGEGNEKDAHKAADTDYPLTGMAYAYQYDYNDNSEKVEDYVVVSGSYDCINDFVSSSCNEDYLMELCNKICHYTSSVNISGTAMTTDGLSFTSQSAPLIGIGVFTVGIPLVLLIVCLVVFLRRKNL